MAGARIGISNPEQLFDFTGSSNMRAIRIEGTGLEIAKIRKQIDKNFKVTLSAAKMLL